MSGDASYSSHRHSRVQAFAARHDGRPGGRWSTPADTARLVAWLISDEVNWITGQVIASDGG